MSVSLIISVAIVLIIALTFVGLLARYRRCASDEILVVFGKSGKKAVVEETYKDENGKTQTRKKEMMLPSKIIHGGGTFVWPVIQDYAVMSLRPLQMTKEVVGLSNQNIKVAIPVTLTTAIGTDPTLMQNAATRLLTADESEMASLIEDILIGEMRSLMATMSIEDINGDRDAFIGKAKRNVELELNKIGFAIININTSDIKDSANYIENLGKKEATKAQAQAQADIAEQKKIGDVKIANTEREREIAVTNAQKEKAIKVAETKKQQETEVANIEQAKQVALAEAERVRATGIAEQQAQQTAAVAEAETKAATAEADQDALRRANVAKAKADAASKEAASESEAMSSVARSRAEAAAVKAEADASRDTRMAKAQQEKEASVEQATQDKEAKIAEFNSERRQRAAEAAKKAGVAEQESTIAVSQAKGRAAKAAADAQREAGVAETNARMDVLKTEQDRQLEVNEAEAKAKAAKLEAESVVPAQKAKEVLVINAEATKQKAILEAEAAAAKILKEAEAEAERIRLTKEAEAEGVRKIALAEAEGKRASLMAEADKETAIGMIPAQVVERMKEAGMTAEMIVQYKTVDRLEGIARAQAEAYEHIHLGQVTVFGNENTAGNFMNSVAEAVMPMVRVAEPIKDAVAKLFAKSNEPKPATTIDELPDEDFENVK